MKKLFLAFAVLLVAGAGCMNRDFTHQEVSGAWALAFDLGEGWVMVAPYDEDSRLPMNAAITHTDSSVVLQSQNVKLCYAVDGVCDDATAVAPGIRDARVYVTMLDPHRKVPSEAEDLGNGFSRVELCEDNGACRAGGKGNYTYYYADEAGNYAFDYYGNTEEAEHVILSATPVTKFTDTPAIEVTAE